MCHTRRTRFRCGHEGPAILTRSCTHQFDYARAQCAGGRREDAADRDIYLHPELCPGCRAARLGIVQPAGWRPLPLGGAHGEGSRSSSPRNSSRRAESDEGEQRRRRGGKTGNFVRFVVGDDDDADGGGSSSSRDAHHYPPSRARRPPKTTGWRYREEAAREQDAHREGARMRHLYRERAQGEDALLRTLIPGTAMLKGPSSTRQGR